MEKIAILTDSSAGFTSKELKNEKYKNIFCLPLHIILNNKKDILDTDENIKKNNFYKIVETGIIKTSQASPGEIIKMYDELLKKYNKIIHYPIAEKLSNQYSTAYKISKEEKYLNKIYVIKNHAAAYSLKKMIIYAQKLINNNFEIKEIINKTKEFEKSSLMMLMPGNLSNLIKGGRVKKILLNMINLLKIKIIIQWGEYPKKAASSRKITTLIENFINIFNKFTKKIKYKSRLFILKTSKCTTKTWNFVTEILNKYNIKYEIKKLPNVFVAHAGLDTIGFITIPILSI